MQATWFTSGIYVAHTITCNHLKGKVLSVMYMTLPAHVYALPMSVYFFCQLQGTTFK